MKNATYKNFHYILILFIGLFCVGNSFGQVRKNFTPRTSDFSPGKTIYSVRGDFTMIGNTNLTLSNYSPNGSNGNNSMIYVDIDDDGSTFNSSSATLNLSNENGANPDCSNIIYAGLYWTGRGGNKYYGSWPNGDWAPEFNDLERRTVKLKTPGQSTYETLVANINDIRYPGDNGMFAGYIEITDAVKDAGSGEYTVADIAISDGNGGNTGYYGGWGMVVVYENSKMNWRDITVFDGYAYVQGSTTISHTMDISGFKAVQNGDVNVKLGMMAGEGDKNISGDYFQIRNANNSYWQPLSHLGNTTNNFFNSSIYTGGNTRNPNLTNNTGLDISMFEVPNPNNSIIANNQTSTRFRYGSTQDTYIIFNVTFSVDAYVPETSGVLSANTVNNAPNPVPLEVVPGDTVQYGLEITNDGTETINNTVITLPIPYTSTYLPGSINYTVNPPLASPPVPAPYFNATLGPTGSIVWDIGDLPLPNNPGDVLATLTFDLVATTDCALLVNDNCGSNVSLTGSISGVGETSQTSFNQSLIQGYQTSGNCIGEPISTPTIIPINSTQYVNDNCGTYEAVRDFYFCNIGNSPIAVTEVTTHFPAGTKFYSEYPLTESSIQYNNANPFPPVSGTYYAIPPGATTCYYQFTINVEEVTSVPTANDLVYCVGDTASPLTATPSDSSYILLYYTDNNPNTYGQTSITPSTINAGTTTYYVAEGIDTGCVSTNRTPITVVVYDNITITLENSISTSCSTSNNGAIDISVTGGSGNYTYSWNDPANSTTQDISNLPVGNYTITVSDLDSSCSASASYDISVNDSTTPIITAPADITVEGCSTSDIKNGNLTALGFSLSEISISESQFTTEGGLFSEENVASITYLDSASGTCPIVVTRTYTITDECGLTATATQTISINDITAPTFTAPDDTEIFTDANCDYDASIGVTGDVTNENDNCSTNLNATYTDVV
ncbi:SprB repeat-containing protein, partial [Bizionia paragorgiae]